jgi:hypothetical protein
MLNYFIYFPCLEKKMLNKKKSLDLQLSDATDLGDPTLGTNVGANPSAFLSPDGSLVYLVYANIASVSPAAQFAANVNGKLSVITSVPVDPLFPNTDDGSPNPCATLFTFLDDNVAIGQGRVRILNSSGATIASRIFTDLFPADPLSGISVFNGGGWSHDSRFVVIVYTFTATSGVLRVLDAQAGLATVGSFFFPFPLFNAPSFFVLPDCSKKHKSSKHCDSYWIAFAPANGGITVFGNVTIVGNACPSLLQVLSFLPESPAIVVIDQVDIPSFAIGLSAWPKNHVEVSKACCEVDKGKFALLAVNTTVAISSSDVSPYKYPTTSCIPDAAELRLYAFDGCQLSLVAAQNNNLRGNGVAFSPNGRYLLSIERSRSLNAIVLFPGCPGEFAPFLEISKIPIKALREFFKNKKVETMKSKIQPLSCLSITRIKGGFPSSFYLSFSSNSKWFIEAGTTNGDVFPIQLFRVVSAPC